MIKKTQSEQNVLREKRYICAIRMHRGAYLAGAGKTQLCKIMDKTSETKKENSFIEWLSRNTLWIITIPATLIILITILSPLYFGTHEAKWELNYGTNGSIGDFFGGIMNPIVALLALVWLVKGVSLQQSELQDTKKALQESEKHQSNQVKIAAITAIITNYNMQLSPQKEHLKTIEPRINYLNAKLKEDEFFHETLTTEENLLFEEYEILLKSINKIEDSILTYLHELKIIGGYATDND